MTASLLVRLFFWLWFGAAVAVGHFLVLQRLPPVAVPGVALALSALLLYVYFRVSVVRAWVDALDLRVLVLIHAARFIGVYFLLLFQDGVLPRAFAVPSGVGDVIVAAMALPVALAPLSDATRQRAIVIWNVVGFVGLLLAVISAFRLNLDTPLELRALTRLPLSLWPTLLAPLMLVSHVVIFARTGKSEKQ